MDLHKEVLHCLICSLLIYYLCLCEGNGPLCQLQRSVIPGIYKYGDMIIGGVFPVQRYMFMLFWLSESEFGCNKSSCFIFSFDFRSYRWIRGMIYAINEINRNEHLLPNFTLGYAIHDTCDNVAESVEKTFTLVTGSVKYTPNYQCQITPLLTTVIGESASGISIAMARILGTYHYPQVSYYSSLNVLSNKKEFPSFFRTIPSDTFQTTAFALLVAHLGWKWVGTLAEDNDYGHLGVQLFTEEVQKLGTCIAFSETIPLAFSKTRYEEIAATIKRSSATVIIVFSGDTNLLPLFWEVAKQNITGRTWLASEGWSTSAFVVAKDQAEYFSGALGLAIPVGHIAGLLEFLLQLNPMADPEDLYIKPFWEHAFGCSWTETKLQDNITLCTGHENLLTLNNVYTDVSQLRITCNVYNAVYAIANALNNILSSGNKKPAIEEIKPWQIIQSLKKVRFTDQAGKILYFDENGDPVAKYDILNWYIGEDGNLLYRKVGSYDASAAEDQRLTLDEQAIIWNDALQEPPRSQCSSSCKLGFRKSILQGQSMCCFDCIPCSEGEISNGSDFTECIKCPEDYWSNKNKDSCIPKDMDFLSFEEPLGITFSVLAVIGISQTLAVVVVFIKHIHTPIVRAHNIEMSFFLLFSLILCFLSSLTFIGKPSSGLCVLRQTVFGVSFALCISCVLVKTLVVILAFTMSKPNQNMMKYFKPSHQRAFVGLATLIQIAICVGLISSANLSIKKNRDAVITKIVLECNLELELVFLFAIGYIALLALPCFVLAFLARNLPDTFNETKFITFSLLLFVMVWVSFIPGYISTKGKYVTAVEIFAILSSAAGLLGCIFFPKYYIILLKPERNTRKNVTGHSSLVRMRNKP
uniref:Extracellular calcium-sensing receptor-like n=1 Tax=Xenopus tropicalis TaxID=8364 RepID=F7BTQ6_XENTR